jgi:1,4-dihydroxy-6-naphthoate synthase
MKPITIYHSPDADDAFMFYGLSCGAIKDARYEIRHELSDIESLNQRTRRGELDVTAVSVHAFSHLKDQYHILRCGASMGERDYGPRLIARKLFDPSDGVARTIAIPGDLTSAALSLRIYLAEAGITARIETLHFEAVQRAVQSGEVDAGVIIHEGQITHQREGLVTVKDFGQWWWEKHRLPLPLGVNVVRASLGVEAIKAVSTLLRSSIEYSLSHRQEALQYALSYGRGLSLADADTFVGMYVNDRTLDLGEVGMRSIQTFLDEGARHGLCPKCHAVFA